MISYQNPGLVVRFGSTLQRLKTTTCTKGSHILNLRTNVQIMAVI